jgi:pimeloyl-ACP methyl ester carboxylesterase
MTSDRRATNAGRLPGIFGPIPRPRRGRHLGLVVTAALITTGAIAPSTAAAAPKLDWQPCPKQDPKGFQCATARVPRNYSHPHRAKLHLAIVRHPATDTARRIGTLFYNPGGPGGPGIAELAANYKYFSPTLRARFDLVSWDPRGVGASTAVRCFASTKDEERFLHGVSQPAASFPVGKTEKRKWIRRYRAFGHRCERTNGRLLRHVSTADTARDLNLLRRAVGDSKLSYYGTSYGTFLGATYANLFPERVRALVLDGNINPKSWAHRRTNLNGGRFLGTFIRQHSDQGTVNTLDAFLNLCGRTNTKHCAFSRGSAAVTREKYDALLRRVRTDPASYDISYADLASDNFQFLTSPAAWTKAAECLQRVWTHHRYCPIERPPAPDALLAIMCSDSPNPGPFAAWALDIFADQRSGAAGQNKSWATEPCGTWPVTAADRYAGPWDRNTANPLLVIGNTHDPNTPYRSAEAMTRQLARARLLTVKGYGHTELTNPSTCAIGWVNRYLIAKTLPPPGKSCVQNLKPFTGSP